MTCPRSISGLLPLPFRFPVFLLPCFWCSSFKKGPHILWYSCRGEVGSMCPPLEYEYNKVTLCDFPRLGHKRPCGFCFWDLGFQKFPLRTPLTNQLPCVRSPATSLVFKSSQSRHPTCEWRSLQMIPATSLKSPATRLKFLVEVPQTSGNRDKPFLPCLVQIPRICEQKKWPFFYTIKFGMVCYTA